MQSIDVYKYCTVNIDIINNNYYHIATCILIIYDGSLIVSPSFVLDTQIYSVLFTGLLTNMLVPVPLCPGSAPLSS